MNKQHYIRVDGQKCTCLCGFVDKGRTGQDRRTLVEKHIRQATGNPNFIDVTQYMDWTGE